MPTLGELLKKRDLQAVEPLLQGLARNTIRFRLDDEGATDRLGASRVGGSPDLPVGASWPTVDGVVLRFFAQLDLAELARHDLDKLLPKRGLLSFFALDAAPPNPAPGFDGELLCYPCVVLFAEPGQKLARLTPPQDVEDEDGCGIALEHTVSLPRLGAPEVAAEARDALAALGPTPVPPTEGNLDHRILGYADARYSRGIPRGGDVLLLGLDTGDDDCPLRWLDADRVFFLLPRASLERRDFAQVVCVGDASG